MKVKIVKEKTQEMTIEQLCNKEYVGMLGECGVRRMLATCAGGLTYGFLAGTDLWCSVGGSKMETIKREFDTGTEFYVFNNARDLYLWLAGDGE